eukprot:14184793-Alexandrium_andersonii.AAC.1
MELRLPSGVLGTVSGGNSDLDLSSSSLPNLAAPNLAAAVVMSGTPSSAWSPSESLLATEPSSEFWSWSEPSSKPASGEGEGTG